MQTISSSADFPESCYAAFVPERMEAARQAKLGGLLLR